MWKPVKRSAELKAGDRVRMLWPRQDALTDPEPNVCAKCNALWPCRSRREKGHKATYKTRWLEGFIQEGLKTVRVVDGGLAPRTAFNRMQRWVEDEKVAAPVVLTVAPGPV